MTPQNIAVALAALIGFELALSLATQATHIFTFPVALAAHALAALYLWRRYLPSLNSVIKALKNPDWFFIVVIVVAVACLGSVHNRYTGSLSTAVTGGYEPVKNFSYPYPYFSDEWYAIAFIQDAITNNRLPTFNPYLDHTSRMVNPALASHSFLAQMILLLHLNPLSDYAAVSVAFGVILVALIYLLLRFHAVSQVSAAIASLLTLYITSGANLPTIWNLIPITLGLIVFLSSLFFIGEPGKKGFILTTLLTLTFYPPLIIFSIAALATKIRSRRVLTNYPLALLGAGCLMIVFFIIGQSNAVSGGPLEFIISSKILYQSFTGQALPNYPVLSIIPSATLAAAIIGYKRTWRSAPWVITIIATGAVFWAIYSQISQRFIIDYQRTIYVVAIFTTVAAGFGIETLKSHIPNKIGQFAGIATLTLFIILTPNYTNRQTWQDLTLSGSRLNQPLRPAAPANQYLTQEDLNIFQDIHRQHFLSLPWKGTVIGTATDNFPATVKPGTITLNNGLFNQFMSASCADKSAIGRQYRLAYVYLPAFSCPGFTPVAASPESLVLYQTIQ